MKQQLHGWHSLQPETREGWGRADSLIVPYITQKCAGKRCCKPPTQRSLAALSRLRPVVSFFFLPFIMLCNAETNDVARPTSSSSSSAHCAKKYLPDAQHVSSSSSGGGGGRGAAAAGEVLEAESRFVCKLRPARLHELFWQPSVSWHKRALNVRTSLSPSLSLSFPLSASVDIHTKIWAAFLLCLYYNDSKLNLA